MVLDTVSMATGVHAVENLHVHEQQHPEERSLVIGVQDKTGIYMAINGSLD
jgi:hypothetical protein